MKTMKTMKGRSLSKSDKAQLRKDLLREQGETRLTLWLAQAMRRKFQENRSKGDWRLGNKRHLYLIGAITNFAQAIEAIMKDDCGQAVQKTANTANYLMIIIDSKKKD